MEGPGLIPVENETKGQASRTTKEGKKYTYRMNVLQQPLRARACGSGAKSSADRRPVDPPPIVELKIFEEGEGEPRDVTFSMNADYFLFTTLEQARNVAHGRIQQDQKSMTVLTGTPVAGMVYLDRPSPAGYFIFPDLSVRHEGKYRLTFSLYEQLKEAKDEDQSDEFSGQVGPSGAYVSQRLEVRSVPFTVYSAKKFPGLTESTSLSRMVAEQGCRVRIRRDVRMRRRDPKSAKDWDGYEDETAEARARMSATPEAASYTGIAPSHGYMDPIARPRSSSNVSHHSLAPSLSISRRPSLQEVNQAYHQPPYSIAPNTPQTAYPHSSPYGPSPSQQYAPSPFLQQRPTMQPPPPQYQPQTYSQPPPLPQAPASQQSYYSYSSVSGPPSAPQSHFASSASSYEPPEQYHRTSMDQSAKVTQRRESVPYGPPPPLPPTPTFIARPLQPAYQTDVTSQASYPPPPPPLQQPYANQHSHQSSYSSLDGYSNRSGPPEPVQPSARPILATPPISGRPSFNDKLPPLNTTLGIISNKFLEPASPSPAIPQGSYFGLGQTQPETHKRGFGQVFNDRHLQQPLRQGARPSTIGHNMDMPGAYYPSTEADNDGFDPNEPMEYRRADGRHMQREAPQHHH